MLGTAAARQPIADQVHRVLVFGVRGQRRPDRFRQADLLTTVSAVHQVVLQPSG
ncbi:hypothetical protein [Dactylosporangium sp. CA-139066]|uniref:hypothetical protein n=1 Tax=Dactylosporangium sp. CA-139066 TaxID=3239930 RepID=UPI003D8C27D9